jgi:Cof subfamily protein (haloacid dehalogenase superfamily)
MTIRLVVSDVDGTLVDKQKRLTEPTVAAVARLRAAGVPFTIISARPRSGLMPIADALGLDEPMAAFNGGLIFRRDGRVEHHETIDPEVASATLAMARQAPVDIWVFADDRWFATTDQGTHVEHERIASDQEPVLGADLEALVARADKLTFVSDTPAVLADLHARARPFDGRATIAQSQTYYLDVTAAGANKGAGIRRLTDARGVPLADTVAIGDQMNDLPMLTLAGTAIAMGNAPDAVKAAATHVTAGNDADGVAHAVATWILGPEEHA